MVREELIAKIMLWFVVSLLAAVVLASYRYPFFIQGTAGNWQLDSPATIEADLLIIASFLIGVAVVQAQNLNRILDMRFARR